MSKKEVSMLTWLRLALLSCAACSLAQAKTEGQIYFDARVGVKHETASPHILATEYEQGDNIHLSRARIGFSGNVAKNWDYYFQLKWDEKENTQFDIDINELSVTPQTLEFIDRSGALASIQSMIARAYLSWSGFDGMRIDIGRIQSSEIASDRIYYQPYIGRYPTHRAVGSILHNTGNHPGISVQGASSFGIGYCVGIWKQTNSRGLLLNNEKVDDVLANRQEHADIFEQHVLENSNNPDELTLTPREFFAKTTQLFTAGSFDERNLRLGFAGRLSFSKTRPSGVTAGLGIGYSHTPLNIPIYAITLAQLPTYVNIVQLEGGGFGEYNISASADNALSSYAYGSASYKNLSHFAVDVSGVAYHLQFNFGFHYQKLSPNSKMLNSAESNDYGFGTDRIPQETTYNFLDRNSSARSHWLEIGYLITGESYQFNKSQAVISGVKLRENQSAVEIVGRYGEESRSNILALITKEGWLDFNTFPGSPEQQVVSAPRAQAEIVSVQDTQQVIVIKINNTGSAQDVQETLWSINTKGVIDFFETKARGFSFGLNYYMNPNIIFKIEYENRRNEFKRPILMENGDEIINDNVWKDSVFNKKIQVLRLRADYSF